MRLIDADVLEKKLKDAIEIGRVYDLDGASNFHAVLSDVEHMPTIEPEPQWISCAERLPEENVNVLIWFEYFRYGDYNRLFQAYGLSYVYCGKWSGFINGESGWRQMRVIAWMPLPEPWKGSGSE